MPAGKIGAGNVADLAGTDERVESVEDFLDGCERIEAVHVVDVDDVGVEAAEAGFAGLNEVITRGADVVGIFAHGERGFRRDEYTVALAGDGFAEDFLGDALRVNVGGVEQIDAGIEADIHEAGGLGDVAAAPGFEEFVGPAEGGRAERENGDLESRVSELSVFHGGWMSHRGDRIQETER